MVNLKINQKVKVCYDGEWQDGVIIELGWEYADVSLIAQGGNIRKIKKELIK